MDKDNKKSLSCFTETATWRFLRPIKTPVLEPQNGFTVARASKVPDESEVRVTVNHDFSETFDKDQLDGKQLAKVGCIILPRACANFILTISSNSFFVIIYFTQMIRLRISLVCTEVQIQSS